MVGGLHQRKLLLDRRPASSTRPVILGARTHVGCIPHRTVGTRTSETMLTGRSWTDRASVPDRGGIISVAPVLWAAEQAFLRSASGKAPASRQLKAAS
jgi:hypothetical protein